MIRPEGRMTSNSTFFFISAGVVSLAVWAKYFVPLFIHFAVHVIPALWCILLKPPYLFVIVNGIIITIAAASRFHLGESEPSVQSEKLISVKTPPSSEFASVPIPIEISTVGEEHPSAVETALACESEDRVIKVQHVAVNDSEVKNVAEAKDEDEFIVSNSTYTPPKEVIPPPFLFPVREKPLASSRYDNYRENLESSTQGPKPSRMTSPKRQESLESIWKMITERYHVPRTRQPGTGEDHEHYVIESPSDNVNKIETYKKHLSPQPPLSSYRRLKVRKELSVGHQEFNRRVEAFIQNFNEELRKQRQESLNQYMEMISHDD